jgi:hypothetical protein
MINEIIPAIKITHTFSRNTYNEFMQAANKLKALGMRKVLLLICVEMAVVLWSQLFEWQMSF